MILFKKLSKNEKKLRIFMDMWQKIIEGGQNKIRLGEKKKTNKKYFTSCGNKMKLRQGNCLINRSVT